MPFPAAERVASLEKLSSSHLDKRMKPVTISRTMRDAASNLQDIEQVEEEEDEEEGKLLLQSNVADETHSESKRAGFSNFNGYIWNSGVACMAIAAFLQSLSALFVKLTDDRVPVLEMVAIRSLACMGSTLLIMGWRRVATVYGPCSSLIPLFIRGMAGALSMSLYYYAIMKLPLPDAMTLFFTHPAMIVGLAWICRGEKVGWVGIMGMLASLLGVALVADPPLLTGGAAWSKDHLLGVGLCLGAAFLAAVAFVSIRFVPKSIGSLTVALWFHSMGVATSGPPLLLRFPEPPLVPGIFDSAMIMGITACSLSSHTFLARAFLIDNASRVAAAGYLQVVFAHLYGILLLHDPESFLGVLGSLVICCGVVAVSCSQPRSTEEGESAKLETLSEVLHSASEAPHSTDDAAIVELLPLVKDLRKPHATRGANDFSTAEPLTALEVRS